MTRTKTHYSILEISISADQEAIKKAYRKLSKKYHPDLGGDQEKFVLVAKAYEVLSDYVLKADYDASLVETTAASEPIHINKKSFMDSKFAKIQKWDIISKLSNSGVGVFLTTYIVAFLIVTSSLYAHAVISKSMGLSNTRLIIYALVTTIASVYLFVKRGNYRKFGVVEQYLVLSSTIVSIVILGILNTAIYLGVYFIFTKIFRSGINEPTRFNSLKMYLKSFRNLSGLRYYVNRINWFRRGNVNW
jgi:hypothetical protein